MQTIFIVSFLSYASITILLGWWLTRKQSSNDEFLLAGRSLPLFLTLGTTIATMVGTGSSMGAVGKGYANGWGGSLYGIGGAIGIFLLAFVFSPIRKFQFSTMADEVAYYCQGSQAVKFIVSVFILLSSVGWLGAHIIGGAMYLEFTTELPPNVCKSIVALSFGIYVIVGGYRAVVWADSLQAIVLFLGFLLVAGIAYFQCGGFDGLNQIDTSININKENRDSHLLPSISLVLSIAVGVLATPSFRQRIYTAKSESVVKKAFFISGILYLSFSILPSIIGMAAYHSDPNLNSGDLAFPHMAMQVLPGWIGVIIILAGMSATMSSASSDAIAGVCTAVKDLPKFFGSSNKPISGSIQQSRVGLFLIVVGALCMSFMARSILGYIESFVALILSGLCVAGILGKLWKPYNSWGMLGSLISGPLVSILVLSNENLNRLLGKPIIPALIVSAVMGVILTLATKRVKSA